MTTLLDKQKIYYQQTIIVWEKFCHLHRALYELTCEEYLTLLESNIDKLEEMISIKSELMKQIETLEEDRNELIHNLNTAEIFPQKILRAGDMLEAFSDLEKNEPISALKNLHSLLIDIIKKIQDQNKKNQLFLNKAIISIREIRDGFSGKKSYTTYGANGQTR